MFQKILVIIFCCIFFLCYSVIAESNQNTKERLAQEYSNSWLLNNHIATKIKFSGTKKTTMVVYVSFQHNSTNKVIHDPTLIDAAKKIGLKRIEFHDWSGFIKDIIFYDIK